MKGLAVVLLVLLRSAPGMEADLYGFSQLVAYFLIGILTLGSAAVWVIMPNAATADMAVRLVCGLAVVLVGDSVF